MVELTAHDLYLSKGQQPLVQNVSAHLKPQELVVLIGPNGAGKSSLLRMLAGLDEPDQGAVMLHDRAIRDLAAPERAQLLAYLPQRRPMAWPLRTRDVVALGRYAHGTSPSQLSGKDQEAVERALIACGLAPLAERSVDSLSGGEEARVHCARVIATEAPLILADEPAASLDPFHQHKIMGLFRAYVDQGGGALVVLHELSLALQYADRVIIMADGAIAKEGNPGDTLTQETLETTYGVPVRIVDNTITTLRA